MATDADILDLARRHLDQGLCFDRQAHITRSTDEKLLAFGRAVAAKAEAEIERLRAERESDEGLLRQALEALERGVAISGFDKHAAIAALRERLGA